MKKNLLLIGLLSFTAVQSFAQNAEWPSFKELCAKFQQPSSGPHRVEVFQPLKAANYSWNSFTSSWEAIDSSFFSYNSQGLETEHLRGADATDPEIRTTTTYDASYRVTEILNQYYDAGSATWINQSKQTFVYDAVGNTTLDEFSNYNVGLSQWEIGYGTQTDYSYNAQNQILSRTFQYYNNTTSTYENSYREINFTYNSFGNPLTWTEEDWDGSNWEPYANYAYFYDVNGVATSAQLDEWNVATSAFIPAIKYENVTWFNWNGNVDESLLAGLTTLIYNSTTSTWETAERQTYTYGVNNSSVELTEVFVNGAFVNDFRNTENIDYQGRTTLNHDESWNASSSSWVTEWQNANSYTYDGSDNLTQEINQFWDQNLLTLVNNLRIDYSDFQSFDNTTAVFTAEANHLKVYPNPMSESVTVSTADFADKATSIQLVDLNGVVVKSIDNLTGTSATIQGEDLKSGCYFVQVKAGATVLATAKLLVN